MTNIIFLVFPLKSWRYLNMAFVMENCKSFVIVLFQSQVLWQSKNAVAVINLEQLFVCEPPPPFAVDVCMHP